MHEDTARDDYFVTLPPESVPLYRAVKGDSIESLTERDFASRAARTGKRSWPDEDAADFHAISCYADPKQAEANAIAHDLGRRKGRTPSYGGIAEFSVNGHDGEVYAYTYEPGHVSAWGPADKFKSSATAVYPIDG